jgi:hypothetical protein
MSDFNGEGTNIIPGTNGMNAHFNSESPAQFANGMSSPLNVGSFQQPFVPQDLWQMPMTLEWDWADITGVGDNSFENMDNGMSIGGL